jgi:hypothetical protein
MACRPDKSDLAQGGQCALAGARGPGAACETHAQCAAESLCLVAVGASGRCVRVCSVSTPGCACVGTNLGVSVCREDMGVER